jgi:hypothetical protein
MIFFVMVTPLVKANITFDSTDADALREQLLKMKGQGLVTRVYHRIDGGSVYILNAHSFVDVRNAFRESSLSATNRCEILEVDQNSPFFIT